MLVGVNQFYLLNEHLLVQNETRVVSQISGTNESINGKHHLEYRCKKASLQFHNRVSNLYILSAPSWILLLCIFALGAAQGGRSSFPSQTTALLQLALIAKLITLLLLLPAAMYLCARGSKIVSKGD